MRNISQASLLSVRLPVTTATEQQAIVERVEELREARDVLGRGLALASARSAGLRRALLEAAFSGRLSESHTVRNPAEEATGV